MKGPEAQPNIPSEEKNKSDVPYNVAKHEQWNTSPETIAHIVSEGGESLIGKPTRIIKGETNEVYAVETKSGRELIVRIYHGDKSRFERESWVLAECAKAGVPVPGMISVQTVKDKGKSLHVCVETKIDGTDGEHAESLDTASILEQLGEQLSKVHSIRTHGFGPLDEHGKGKYETVGDLIESVFRSGKDRILPHLKEGSSEAQSVMDAIMILKAEAPAYSHTIPHLIHNDLSPDHILVKDGKIAGIVDFESAFSGDPALEFALWDFKHGKKYPIDLIRKGYTNTEVFSGNFEQRFNFWRLYRALVSLRYCLQEKKQKGIDRALKAVEQGVEYFSATP